MPAKAPLDENVRFLFSCLLRSDYKTIDFARVAADFSINPAAARMRWSRLKKTINPDEESMFFTESPKTRLLPKEPTDSKEPKEKEVAREIHKMKRAERKAKIRAGQRISEQQTQTQDPLKTEDKDIFERPLTPEKTQQGDIIHIPQFSPFGLFQPTPVTPSTLASLPITPSSIQTTFPETDDETKSRSAWGSTITVKHNLDPITEFTNISAITTGSPASASSFSPGSSTRTSTSPPAHAAKKQERLSQRWRATRSCGGRQARGRTQENVSGIEKDIEA